MHILRRSIIALLFVPALAGAQDTSFSDVPGDHPAFGAIEYLREQGILQGYADGTFRPDTTVNRAEAVKIIVAPLVDAAVIAQFTASVYDDVSPESWYKGYVEAARQKLKILDGPPQARQFFGERPVNLSEFLKMLFLANNIDAASNYGEIQFPLSSDIPDATQWYYPYMRYALTASMTTANDEGKLRPARQLTRGEVALLLYRLTMYREGRRTQALLSQTESEIANIVRFLGEKKIGEAEFASTRALLAARGALTGNPDEAQVKGAVKIAEGFRLLVLAYKAGVSGDPQSVIDHAGDAWHLAEKATGFWAGYGDVASRMQDIAKGMADEARTLLSQ